MAELALAGACTLEAANRVLWDFLPRFSARFGVPAAQPGSAYRPVEEGFDLESVLCIKEVRRVAKDNTVQYHGRTLQLFPEADRPSPSAEGPGPRRGAGAFGRPSSGVLPREALDS